jgi:hypothetical protein
MFRSLTIIRELALNFYIYVKIFAEIKSLFIVRLCGSMSWNGVVVLCCAECTAYNTHGIL